jgi:two-component system phosphate regulon response regulator PhoB
VLIVDDHPDSLAVYAFGLLAMGFQPVMANNLEDGFARACELHPDVVVADITLGDPVGAGFTQRFRDDPRTNQAGLIALTTLTPRALNAGGQEPRGCDRVLLKPCSPDALAFEIHDLLTRRSGAAANMLAPARRPPGSGR